MTEYSNNKKQLYIAIFIFSLSFIWAFWPNISDLFRMWQTSDEYSSGMLVPVMAGFLLYNRLKVDSAKPKVFWPALLMLLFAQITRICGVLLMSAFLERAALLIAIYSAILLILGHRVFIKHYSIMLFLVLMIPLPNSIHSIISPSLQKWATHSAVFILEMFGYNVMTEGNIINIGSTSVAVAEACNGLRMITAFFVTTGLISLIIHKPSWQKVVVIISTLPIALICNTVRLVITSIAFTMIKAQQWEKLFHDFGGFAMMPLAILLVIAELAFMNMLIVADKTNEKTASDEIILKKVKK